jgi:hypothetical protein
MSLISRVPLVSLFPGFASGRRLEIAVLGHSVVLLSDTPVFLPAFWHQTLTISALAARLAPPLTARRCGFYPDGETVRQYWSGA